jgi:hypothetical protein
MLKKIFTASARGTLKYFQGRLESGKIYEVEYPCFSLNEVREEIIEHLVEGDDEREGEITYYSRLEKTGQWERLK